MSHTRVAAITTDKDATTEDQWNGVALLSNGYTVWVSYRSGAYLEVYFHTPEDTGGETLNVWDHETGKPDTDMATDIGQRQPDDMLEIAVAGRLEYWMADLEDNGWPTWHEDYQRNTER